MIYVISLYALFASVFVLAKNGLNYVQPFFLVGSRMFIAGVILLAYQKIRYRQAFTFNRQTWIRLFQLALFNIYLTNILEFWGLRYLTSAKTCFIYSLSPFLSALFSYLLFNERLNSKKWLGLGIGFIGFLPILLSHTAGEDSAGQFYFFSWAELAVMGAATCSVYGWIVLRQLINDNGLSPLTANGMSMLIGGVCALVHSFLNEEWNPIPVTNYTVYIECTILLILISNLICYNLYGYLLKRYSATFISLAGFTTPLFTALFGWFFLDEVVSWHFYFSFGVVLSGLLVFDQEEIQQTYQNQAVVEKSFV